jgi:hypothetical protein
MPARYRDRVAAGTAKAENQSAERLGSDVMAAGKARQRRGAVLDQPGPDFRPIGPARQAKQAHPQQPIDVGGGEPGDAEHIGDAPRLGRDAEQAKFERRFGGAGQMVVDAGDKPVDPVARRRGQRLFDQRHGAGRIEQPQPMVEADRDRAEHFGEAALYDAAQQFHLREAQMRVDEAERHRQIAVAARLDERDEPIVPADLDRRGERQAEARQGGETLRDRLRARPMAQSRPGEPPGEAGDPGDRC